MAILHTGSPHFIRFVQNAVLINVVEEGRKVRYSSSYKADGINVNFVEVKPGSLFIRTYERGVEDETLSCGTGVTAAVLAAAWTQRIPGNRACNVNTPGGELQVSFTMNEQGFTNVVLKGPADFVFKGIIDL
jgi:diaminopimelate epimerase